MNLSEMRDVLARRDIQLTKSLGQNFLHDRNQLQKIVEAAELTKVDKILEIGPGLGPLTELLLEKAVEVLAIEMDGRLVEFLREHFKVGQASRLPGERDSASIGKIFSPTLTARAGETPALLLLHADALKFLRGGKRDWSDWKLVSNLPYSVASPILVELAQNPQRPKRIVATLQLEVAQRLMAKADDDDYGVLTLLVQLRYEPKKIFKIPADCFFPVPDVDSACVILERREKQLLPGEKHPAFEKIVKCAFSQRRKMMLKLLKAVWPVEKLERGFAELGLSPQARAETVSLEQFVRLTQILAA